MALSFSLLLITLALSVSADESQIQINGHTVKQANSNSLINGFDIPKEGIQSCSHIPFHKLLLPNDGTRPEIMVINRSQDRKIQIQKASVAVQDYSVMNIRAIGVDQVVQVKPGKSFPIELSYTCIEESNKNWSYITLTLAIKDTKKQIHYFQMEMVAYCEADAYPLDFSPWILFAFAVFTLALVTRQQVIKKEEGAMEVKPCAAVIWIIFASISLCLLFYFLEYLQVLLRIMVCFVACLALTFVVENACCERLVDSVGQQRHFNWQRPIFRTICCCESLSELLALILSTIVTITYFFSSHWMLTNILAFSLTTFLLKSLLLNSWKAGCILLLLGFIYDVFWVFISPALFGGRSVMASVATQVNLPILFEFPHLRYLYDAPTIPNACSKLGLGDLIFPGLLLSFLYRFDKGMRRIRDAYTQRPSTRNISYWTAGLLGYALSLLLCGIGLYAMGLAQPVLFYIVPIQFAIVWILAWRRKECEEIWTGSCIQEAEESGSSQSRDGVRARRLENTEGEQFEMYAPPGVESSMQE